MSNNPPAFPLHTNYKTEDGMTLRDYFAAKAMQSYCIDPYGKFDDIAIDAYHMADAMLKEREKQI